MLSRSDLAWGPGQKPFVNHTNHVAHLQQKIAVYAQIFFAEHRDSEHSRTPPTGLAAEKPL